MTIGERIKKKRIESQLTQEDLAQKIGSTKQTIYKYENNIITSIPLEKLALIAETLGISPADLLGWDTVKINKSLRAEDGYFNILNDIYQKVTEITPDDDETPSYILEYSDTTKLILSEEKLMDCFFLIKSMIPKTISFLVDQENQNMVEEFSSRLSLCGATFDEATQLQARYRTILKKARLDIDLWNCLSEHEIDLLNSIKNPKFKICKIRTREEALNYLNHLWESSSVAALHLEEKKDSYLINFANKMKATYPYIE